MIGGKVIGIVRQNAVERDSLLHVEDGHDRCSIRVRDDWRIRLGDAVWWQSGLVMWTPRPKTGDRCGVDFDIKLQRAEWPYLSKLEPR